MTDATPTPPAPATSPTAEKDIDAAIDKRAELLRKRQFDPDTARASLKGMPDNAQVSLMAGTLRAAGLSKSALKKVGCTEDVPDGRPVENTGAMFKAAFGVSDDSE
jgi:hypothetical protein